ncbi:hypothetical protein [Blastococcus deserti]|uniref:Uncharacterized protein n=1 Tax=Blastococcus deserti TaxID=2259033 RepID=A0ABW4X7L1_9ACTN
MRPRHRRESALQRELLAFLRPPVPRLAAQVSEQARPRLAEIGRSHAHRPAAEVLVALEAAVRSVGGEPDRVALTEFAEQIEAGENPFA